MELRHLRDRVRKSLTKWLGDARQKDAPLRLDWQLEASQLTRHLCHWGHNSALTRVGMTDALAELTRQHRRAEGAELEPPPSKNTLALVVWDLAVTVQAKLVQWRECVLAGEEESFDGVIVVRTSNVVPIFAWEADILRNRPALQEVCNRMLSMDLWLYRQHCHERTREEKQLLRDQEPYWTSLGLHWRARQQLPSTPLQRPNTAQAGRTKLTPLADTTNSSSSSHSIVRSESSDGSSSSSSSSRRSSVSSESFDESTDMDNENLENSEDNENREDHEEHAGSENSEDEDEVAQRYESKDDNDSSKRKGTSKPSDRKVNGRPPFPASTFRPSRPAPAVAAPPAFVPPRPKQVQRAPHPAKPAAANVRLAAKKRAN